MAKENSYTLTHILLLESSFSRGWIINFEDENFKNTVDIEVANNGDNQNVNVVVTLKYRAGIGEKNDITSEIKMVGIFTIPEESELPREQFININAPAIIFPFIREHLSSLSIKAGLSPILLQPVNFVKHSQNVQKTD